MNTAKIITALCLFLTIKITNGNPPMGCNCIAPFGTALSYCQTFGCSIGNTSSTCPYSVFSNYDNASIGYLPNANNFNNAGNGSYGCYCPARTPSYSHTGSTVNVAFGGNTGTVGFNTAFTVGSFNGSSGAYGPSTSGSAPYGSFNYSSCATFGASVTLLGGNGNAASACCNYCCGTSKGVRFDKSLIDVIFMVILYFLFKFLN